MNKKVFNSLKYLTMVTQIGVSVMMPCFIFIFGALWLKEKFNLGGWVVIAGILLGIATGCTTVYKYMKDFFKDMSK